MDTGYWKLVKSKKGAGILPVRVRIPWPATHVLLHGDKEITFRLGTLERWEERGKYGGGLVTLDNGGRIMVQPGQFEVWAERESG